ncbi:MAG: hypothetical protein WBW73_05885 [Rhodoplanes sp.]
MLLQLAVGVIAAYSVIVGVMYLAQRSLMYARSRPRLGAVREVVEIEAGDVVSG